MIRFAVIGTNFITDWFIEAVAGVSELSFYSVYSRDIDKAMRFGKKYGISRCYDQLADLAEDKNVDAVYIASPNCCHCEQAILMMNHGKHVLCEKPIASNHTEFKRMEKAAGENHVILLEAMRTTLDPAFTMLQEQMEKLGKIRQVIFHFCKYSSRYDDFKNGAIANAFRPEFSNGALMDIGVYCVHPMVKLFGLPTEIMSNAIKLENGVDGAGMILAGYPEGMQVQLVYSKICNNYLPSQIMGEKGTLVIEGFPIIKKLSIHFNSGETKVFELQYQENNMQHEAEEFVRLIKSGDAIEPHLRASEHEMIVMDEIRKQAGIIFPAD